MNAMPKPISSLSAVGLAANVLAAASLCDVGQAERTISFVASLRSGVAVETTAALVRNGEATAVWG
jgi:hypothetical protein